VNKADEGTDASKAIVDKSGQGTDASKAIVDKAGQGTGASKAIVDKAGEGTDASKAIVDKSGQGTDASKAIVDKSGQGTDASKAIVYKAQSVGESDEQKAKSGWQRASKPGQAGDAKGAALGSARTETNELMKQLDTVAAAAAEAAVPIVRSAMEYWEEKEQRDQAPASGSKEVGKALSIMGGYWRDPRIQAPRAASKYAGKHKAEQARGSAKFQEARASFRKQFGKRKTLDERQKEWKAKQNAPEPDAKTHEIGQALLKLLGQQAGGGAGDKAEGEQGKAASLKGQMSEDLSPEEKRQMDLAIERSLQDSGSAKGGASDEDKVSQKLGQLDRPRKIVPVVGDGDCLYNSIIKTSGIGLSVRTLRNLVADTMEFNQKSVQDWTTSRKQEGAKSEEAGASEEKGDLKQQVAENVRAMGKYDSEFGDLSPHILSSILGVPLMIVKPDAPPETTVPGAWKLPEGVQPLNPPQSPIVLAYVRKNHYQATEEAKSAEKEGTE
jgi:hypothetical protein